MGDITVIADAGDDNRRRGGEQQGRDLRHQPIADSHQHILLEGGVGAQVVFEDADTDAADQVDRQNHHPGDGVPAHKLRCPVHCAVEIGLAGNIFTPGLCLRLVDQSGVKIGVNRHLFTGHRVQGKAGRNLGDTLGPFGDDNNDHQDDKHHETDDKVAANHHLTKRLNHLTRRAHAEMAM